MHSVLNLKHRIIRRQVDVGKAPLATFDTIDLGDGDTQAPSKGLGKKEKSTSNAARTHLIRPGSFVPFVSGKSGTIGGNNSKKSLSHAGGGKDEKKDGEAANKVGGDGVRDKPDETGTVESPQQSLPSPSLLLEKDDVPVRERKPSKGSSPCLEAAVSVTKDNKEQDKKQQAAGSIRNSAVHASGLNRQGTLGRVSIPIKKQDSISSSSSSETCNDAHFTFTATRPSIAHLDSADAGLNLPDSAKDKNSLSSLIPENIDPSQILSPSKRKAYEKRIERLKVTTSPIARPRSTAPISVVTLDEYAILSSPDASPGSPSVLQDKLKITLPSDEFTSKPRTPKHITAKRCESEEGGPEFAEEILFRCTKSALVVEEDGNLPLSPRRVLIPPTLTPASSPNLSTSPSQNNEIGSLSDTTPSAAPKLIYFKEDVNAQTFFGKTVDETENESWANFSDSPVNFEAFDLKECETDAGGNKCESVLSKELSDGAPLCVNSPISESRNADDQVFLNSEDKTDYNPFSINQRSDNEHTSNDVVEDLKETNSSPVVVNSNNQTSYNIHEHSDDVLVLEIINHECDTDREKETCAEQQNSISEDLEQKIATSAFNEATLPSNDDNSWAVFESSDSSAKDFSCHSDTNIPVESGTTHGQSLNKLTDSSSNIPSSESSDQIDIFPTEPIIPTFSTNPFITDITASSSDVHVKGDISVDPSACNTHALSDIFISGDELVLQTKDTHISNDNSSWIDSVPGDELVLPIEDTSLATSLLGGSAHVEEIALPPTSNTPDNSFQIESDPGSELVTRIKDTSIANDNSCVIDSASAPGNDLAIIPIEDTPITNDNSLPVESDPFELFDQSVSIISSSHNLPPSADLDSHSQATQPSSELPPPPSPSDLMSFTSSIDHDDGDDNSSQQLQSTKLN